MIGNRVVGLTVAALGAVVVLVGCTSGSTGTSPDATANPAIIGQVPAASISEPPADLVKAAGISPAVASAAVAQARTFTWNLVRVGDTTIAAACMGSGSPTVVYSNGLIIQAAWTWPTVASRQAKTNRVCMFDRPGTGLSPTRPDSTAPNGPVANANELLALMQALNEPGPYLLVGWSYGGLVVRTAAAISPASVAGLDLIDAVTPTQYRTFDRTGWTEANQDLDMAAAEKVIAGATSGLGAKPLVVLEAGVRSEPGITNQVWTAAQQAAAKISTNSVFGIVTDSTHPIPQLNPAAVQASVDAISASVKSGQAMPSCPATFAPAGIKCQ